MKLSNRKSQAQIARDLGMTPAYLCQILTGAVKLPHKRAYQWSKSIGRDMDWWMNAKPEEIKTFIFNQLGKEAIK